MTRAVRAAAAAVLLGAPEPAAALEARGDGSASWPNWWRRRQGSTDGAAAPSASEAATWSPGAPLEVPKDVARDHCAVCEFHGAWGHPATKLYIDGRGDGLGNTMEAVIYGMAMAAHVGMNFGGVVHGQHLSHTVDTAQAVANAFGVSKAALFPSPKPTIYSEKKTWQEITQAQASPGGRLGLGDSVLYMTNLPQFGIKDEPVENYLTPEFLRTMREQVMPRFAQMYPRSAIHPESKGIMVAFHLRRGDVKDLPEGGNWGRYTPNEWYLDLMTRIQKYDPKADFHIWSSLRAANNQLELGRNSTFDVFREKGVTVHLDTDEVETWAQMAQADVFVGAKSSFSFFPALLTNGCVLHQKWLTRGLATWVDADIKTGPSDKGLERCMEQAEASWGAKDPKAPS